MEFHKVVNHMLTMDEFEKAWDFLLKKYNLRSQRYMTELFLDKNKWAFTKFTKMLSQKLQKLSEAMLLRLAGAPLISLFINSSTALKL